MRKYSVRQLAALAGISARTLHHYDQIGLLRPHARTAAGSRIYGIEEVQRLQQILLYRERGLSLNEINRRLALCEHDPVHALNEQRKALEKRVARLSRILHVVDATLAQYESDPGEMTARDYLAAFAPEGNSSSSVDCTRDMEPSVPESGCNVAT